MHHKGSDFSAQRISIRFTVGGLFIVATLLTAVVAIGFQFYFSKQIATENALTTYNAMSKTVSRYIRNIDEDASSTTRLLAQIGSTGKFANQESESDVLQIMAEAMINNPHFYSLYIASKDDTFFQLINLESSSIVREKIEAKKEDRWVQIKIFNKGNERVKETYYFMDGFKLRYKKQELSNYFPTKRPWYASAGKGHPFKSAPYLFQHLKITGQTYSIFVPNTERVLGVDIVLSSISYAMVNSNLGKASDTHKEAFIYKSSGDIIASNKGAVNNKTKIEIKPLALTDQDKQLVKQTRSLKVSNQLAWGPIDYAVAGKPQGYAIDLLDIISKKTGLRFEYINGFSWLELVNKYKEGELDILHSVLKTQERATTQAVSKPLYELPFTIVTKNSKANITDVSDLSNKKVAILEGWSIISVLKRQYPNMEIITYPSAKEVLVAVQTGQVFAAIETSLIVKHTISQYFIEGLTLHDEVTGFDGGGTPVFHLMMDKNDQLIVNLIDKAIEHISPENIKALNNKWHNTEGNQLVNDTVVPYLPLLKLANDDTYHNQLVEKEIDGVKHYFFVSMLNEDEFFAVVIPSKLVFSQVNEKVFLSIIITMTLMCLLLPLAWCFGAPIVKPIRLLEEETLKIKHRDYDSVQQIETRISEVWELSASIVAMAQDLKQHEKAQEEFVEAFIQLIAQAIDDKSPYTAGHCNRVPELGMLLASAAEISNMEAFKSFEFKNDDERREFRIAAWLHDCGKITTPEHIVDKGSKLETNYNRIHEVRMRFEVLWRDAEITYFKQLKENPEHEAKLKEALIATQNRLKDDFSFVASANVGAEFMSDDHIARIQLISEQTWDRYFDDQLGLSPIEELAITKESVELPVKEPLLRDKKEHIIKRERKFDIDPKFGIKMDVPEHQYNLGEVYNLTIRRGTLTAEDRFKINEHMISTIKMLENLPFPPELARVPRYASTHHETLKGTGYPRKLMAEDLSVPERILVLADIFEALTAADRPYKKAKPISVAIDIMYKMTLDQHIDSDVFKLFLKSGVYLDYANKYLSPSQIDNVQIEKYI